MKSRLSDVEAVLLTGGASRRMGTDKASLMIDGRPLAERVAAELAEVCDPVTVLGREPLEGYLFLADKGEYEGPLAALSRFEPRKEKVFVASCDLPGFSHELVAFLHTRVGASEAALTEMDGRLQPLCAIYDRRAIGTAKDLVKKGERRVMTWIETLDKVVVSSSESPSPHWVKNVNTPSELKDFIRSTRNGSIGR